MQGQSHNIVGEKYGLVKRSKADCSSSDGWSDSPVIEFVITNRTHAEAVAAAYAEVERVVAVALQQAQQASVRPPPPFVEPQKQSTVYAFHV